MIFQMSLALLADPAASFAIRQLAAPAKTGPLIALDWHTDRLLLASRENGPLLALSDPAGAGVLDTVRTFSDGVRNCRSLCSVGSQVFAVGDGPAGAGVYRLRDAGSGVASEPPTLVLAVRGGLGKNGPHRVAFGPDGWLYFCTGSGANPPASPGPRSPDR